MLVCMWRTGSLCALLVGLQPLWKTVQGFLKKKIKNRSTVWLSKLNSRNIPKGNENTTWKWYLHPQVHSSIVYHSQDIKQCAIYRRVGAEMWCIYKGILFSHKQRGLLPFRATWMDLEGVMLSEMCQTEKDKYRMLSLICGILKETPHNKKVRYPLKL